LRFYSALNLSLKIAILTVDARPEKSYKGNPETPCFGAALVPLFDGFESLGDGCEIHVVSCAKHRLPSPKKLADNIWFHSLYVPQWGWLRGGYLGCAAAVRRLLHELKPDIVHGQGTEKDCSVSAVLSGYPNVLTLHGNMRELARLYGAKFPSYEWCAGKLEAFVLPRTGGVFCNSGYTESLVRPVARRTWRVPNALRREFFRPPKERTNNAEPVLLNVGVVSPRKRQVELLRMAGELYQEGKRFQFYFVGSCGTDSYGNEFTELMGKSGAFARYLGTMEAEELVGYFDRSEALVHFPEEEAFGLVVGEGLARGLKFFGAQVGGLIDITEGVEDAELVAVDQFEELRRRIAAWLGDGAPRSKAGVRIAKERYAPEVVARRHLEIYREVLSVRPKI